MDASNCVIEAGTSVSIAAGGAPLHVHHLDTFGRLHRLVPI
jgi:hypothetical protein